MKIYYRPITDRVEDSLQYIKTFNNLEKLCDYLIKYYSFKNQAMFSRNNIIIQYEGFETISQWETYAVCTKKTGDIIHREPKLLGYITIK